MDGKSVYLALTKCLLRHDLLGPALLHSILHLVLVGGVISPGVFMTLDLGLIESGSHRGLGVGVLLHCCFLSARCAGLCC